MKGKTKIAIATLLISVFAVSVFSFFYVRPALANTDISTCQELNMPDTIYNLTADITNFTQNCFTITANNVTVDCGWHTVSNEGYASFLFTSNYTTIRNCIINNSEIDYYDGAGIIIDNYLIENLILNYSSISGGYYADNGIMQNLSFKDSNRYYALDIFDGQNNTYRNMTVDCNNDDVEVLVIEGGIVNSTFANITATNGCDVGIEMDNSNNNTFENNSFTSTYGWATIYLGSSNYNTYKNNIFIQESSNENLNIYGSNNTFYNNVFQSTNPSSTLIEGDGYNNSFYNNIFNGTLTSTYLLYDTIYHGNNTFNITNQSGINIWNSTLGYIGGNYWTNSESTGYSNICPDLNGDGYCDIPYTLAINNIDYLPLTNNTFENWSYNQTNNTLMGLLTEFKVAFKNSDGFLGYIFSFDNGTGTYANDTWTDMTGTGNWSITTKTINDTEGSMIRWKVYANTTANDWITTDDFSFLTTSPIHPSTCTVLDQTGETYLLTADIINSKNSTCMNITSDNITFNCQGHTIDGKGNGYGIYINQVSNLTVRNCIVTEWNENIYGETGISYAIFENVSTTLASQRGMVLSGVDINITNSTFSYSNSDGLDIAANNSEISNSTFCNNTGNGGVAFLGYSNYFNNISFHGNTVCNNSGVSSIFFIFLNAGNSNSYFYNNLFANNSYFVDFFDNIPTIYWNTTNQTSTNIIGGNETGGNYWSKSDNSGFSDTCNNVNSDSFCDDQYTLATDNIDYLPLTSNIGDINPPAYSNPSVSSTAAGYSSLFSLNWSDNVNLSSYIFSTNNSGIWDNSSSILFSGITNTSTYTITLNSTINATIGWCYYANDTSNNWNANSCANPFTITTDGIPPIDSGDYKNISVYNSTTLFTSNWTDNVGLSGYIFSVDDCNGTFVNDTWTPFTTNPQQVNVTKELNGSVGCTGRWQMYANDTSNNWNAGGINIFTIYSNAITDCLELNISGIYLFNSSINKSKANAACINITADNVTLDLNGYTLVNTGSNGIGVYSNSSDTVIENGTVANSAYGIKLENGSNNQIINIYLPDTYGLTLISSTNNNILDSSSNLPSSQAIGLSLFNSSNNFFNNYINTGANAIILNLSDNNTFNNTDFNCESQSITLINSNYNTFENSNFISYVMINLIGSNNNTFTKLTMKRPFFVDWDNPPFVLSDSNYNLINDSLIYASSAVKFTNSSFNLIYNNLLFTSLSPVLTDSISVNYFNTTSHSGTNMIGQNSIGGNFYDTGSMDCSYYACYAFCPVMTPPWNAMNFYSSHTSFSYYCTDVNLDGFCDAPYSFNSESEDMLALTSITFRLVAMNDTTPPTYSSPSTSNTMAGASTNFQLSWTDDFWLNGYIFSTNNTGIWVNSSWTAFPLGFTGISQSQTYLNPVVGTVVDWCFYANDTSNNWNGDACQNPFSLTTTADTTPPTYSNSYTNFTIAGEPVKFRLTWADNVGLGGFIFSFDNCTGTFMNDTFIEMTGRTNYSTVIKTINSTKGCTGRWKIYTNDTSNNWQVSSVYSFVTIVTYLNKTYQVNQSLPTGGIAIAIGTDNNVRIASRDVYCIRNESNGEFSCETLNKTGCTNPTGYSCSGIHGVRLVLDSNNNPYIFTITGDGTFYTGIYLFSKINNTWKCSGTWDFLTYKNFVPYDTLGRCVAIGGIGIDTKNKVHISVSEENGFYYLNNTDISTNTSIYNASTGVFYHGVFANYTIRNIVSSMLGLGSSWAVSNLAVDSNDVVHVVRSGGVYCRSADSIYVNSTFVCENMTNDSSYQDIAIDSKGIPHTVGDGIYCNRTNSVWSCINLNISGISSIAIDENDLPHVIVGSTYCNTTNFSTWNCNLVVLGSTTTYWEGPFLNEIAIKEGRLSDSPNFSIFRHIVKDSEYTRLWDYIKPQYPQWSNVITNSPTYFNGSNTNISIDWNDSDEVWMNVSYASNINMMYIESNFTGIDNVISKSSATQNNSISYSYNLTPGTYYWKSYATESRENNGNMSDTFYITILGTAPPNIGGRSPNNETPFINETYLCGINYLNQCGQFPDGLGGTISCSCPVSSTCIASRCIPKNTLPSQCAFPWWLWLLVFLACIYIAYEINKSNWSQNKKTLSYVIIIAVLVLIWYYSAQLCLWLLALFGA